MQRFIEDQTHEEFEVVIIGGGITGAAIAYEAASRGMRVALLEKSDFSGATSAATSKMIHGGFRYLANLEIGLVRESLKERRIMENIAPNFVYPFPMMMVHYTAPLMNKKWVIKVGMVLYDILSYDKGWTWDKGKKLPVHRTLSRNEVIDLIPNIKEEGMTGASVFYDCVSICPERLTLAFIKSAVRYGAKVANYAKVEGFCMGPQNTITGVKGVDLLQNSKFEVKGAIVLNCSGPWADLVLGLARKDITCGQLRRSEGIHIITREISRDDYVIGAVAPKGGHFFLIPWRGHTLIGTTDTEYVGSPDDYCVTKPSIVKLIGMVNDFLGNESLKYQDVLYAYGGLRPLVEDPKKGTYESSRKYEICDNALDGLKGLITVEGGKYTTSRNLAEKVLDLIENKLGISQGRCVTDKQYLYGSEIRDMDAFLIEVKQGNEGFSANTLGYLGRHYGTEYKKVLSLASENRALSEIIDPDGEILAQVIYAVRNEMARTLSDILFHRTGIGTVGHPGRDVLEKVALLVAKELGWDDARIERELAQCEKILKIPTE